MAASESGPKPTAHEVEPGCSLPGRRRFLKQSAGAVATIATAGAASGTAAADDDDFDYADPSDVVSMKTSGPVAIFRGMESVVSESFSDDNREDAEQMHAQLFQEAQEMALMRGSALNSIEDNAELLRGFVRGNMALEIANRTEAGDDEDEVLEAAEDVVSEDIANPERELMNAWIVDYESLTQRLDMVYDSDEIDDDYAESELFYFEQWDGDTRQTEQMGALQNDYSSDSSHNEIEQWAALAENIDEPDDSLVSPNQLTFNLLDGGSITIPVSARMSGSNEVVYLLCPVALTIDDQQKFDDTGGVPDGGTSLYDLVNDLDGDIDDGALEGGGTWVEYAIQIYPHDLDYGTDSVDFVNSKTYIDVHHELLEVHDDMIDEAESLVDMLYEPISEGEIDAHDISSGRAILEQAENAEDWQDMAGYYRAMWFPEAEEACAVDYQGVELEGKMFWTSVDDDGLPVGETIDPDETVGELHMAAEIQDGDDLEDVDDAEGDDDLITVQLDEEFTIEETADDSSTLHFEDRELTEPEDPEDIMDDLEAAYAAEEETREGDTEVTVEAPSIPGFPDGDSLGQGASLLGLGLIGVVILAVIGFVTDLIPGLGN